MLIQNIRNALPDDCAVGAGTVTSIEECNAVLATGSTLISQLIDSFVVLFIAFKIGADWTWSLFLAVGTCNYILSEMEKTKDNFRNVLTKAQKLGYAEPGNPKLDLNGYDALAKVKILSALAFNKRLSNSVSLMEGIENVEPKDFEIADQLNLRIKLLGITEIINNKLFERVHPCLVKKNTYIGNVGGVMNAVILEGKPVGESVLQGEGAGPEPTSSALMSDLMSILRGNIKYPFGIPSAKRNKIKSYDLNNYENSLYIRFEVKDKPGVLSQITKKITFFYSIKRLKQKM